MNQSPLFSIIVPVRDEPPEAAERFRALASQPRTEIVVADAGDRPETTQAFRAIGARVISVPGPRGARLSAAARKSRGEIFLFLHADSDPPADALAKVAQALGNGAAGGAFSLAYRDADRRMRWIAWWANLRSRWLRLPFGDQGLFCRREAYERAGGYRALPICDDVDFVRRLKRVGLLVIRPEKTTTSARRYVSRGAWKQVLTTWRVLAGYFAGVAPEKLERWYNAK